MRRRHAYRLLVAVLAFSAVAGLLAADHRWPLSLEAVNETLQVSAAAEAALDAGAIGYTPAAQQPELAATTTAPPRRPVSDTQH